MLSNNGKTLFTHPPHKLDNLREGCGVRAVPIGQCRVLRERLHAGDRNCNDVPAGMGNDSVGSIQLSLRLDGSHCVAVGHPILGYGPFNNDVVYWVDDGRRWKQLGSRRHGFH
jgi:hypothetical protein